MEEAKKKPASAIITSLKLGEEFDLQVLLIGRQWLVQVS
jgi:hypothetical protein